MQTMDGQENTLHMVYQRMSAAIYEKLRKCNFTYVPKYNKIVHTSRETDGFAILYRLIESQHPNLQMEKKKPDKPAFANYKCLFDFITEYQNWLDIESISERKYNITDQLEHVLDQVKDSWKFKDAYDELNSEYLIFK